MLIFDCETDGLIPELTTLHCLVIFDTDTGKTIAYNDQKDGCPSIKEGLRLLRDADCIIAHNAIAFDILAIQKVYPKWKPKGLVRDTLVLSRLIYADMKERDFIFRKRHPQFPGQLIGRHSLEAWGHRLGHHKGDYAKDMKAKGLDPWAAWNPEMQAYCVLDVEVLTTLWNKLVSKKFSDESIQLEHDVARIVHQQEQHGFLFDRDGAVKLEGVLRAKYAGLTSELTSAFPPWEVTTTRTLIPKRDNKPKGYVAGVPVKIKKTKTVVFNPASRDHIANRLTAKYGWKPVKFTDGGKPAIDEAVLAKLKYPEAVVLSEYLMIEKRLGQVADGNQAWLKKLKADDRIHGRVDTNGCVTGRMSHSNPNVAQVPKVGSPYGAECRALFTVPKGKVLVGADASGLELRCLAHYLGKWDAGAYADVILNGDVHTHNMHAAGLTDRSQAKVLIYATLYGAGAAKIGSIVGKGSQAGTKLKTKFITGIVGFKQLLDRIAATTSKRGYLLGLDGRRLSVRSAHAALNTLLQSAGAIVMKKTLVLFDDAMRAKGYTFGKEYAVVASIHDEYQVECDPAVAEIVGKTLVQSIQQAGKHYDFKCPLSGEYSIGSNWAETH